MRLGPGGLGQNGWVRGPRPNILDQWTWLQKPISESLGQGALTIGPGPELQRALDRGLIPGGLGERA